jgi:copper homeostasis protein
MQDEQPPHVKGTGADETVHVCRLQVMLSDIEACSKLGAHGVVFGCLLPDGDVDVDATRQLVHQAQEHVSTECCTLFAAAVCTQL